MDKISLGVSFAAGLSLISSAGAQQVIQDPASACSSIASTFTYPNATITSADHVPAGTILDSGLSCNQTTTVPADICRVGFNVSTSARSGIVAEAWLPVNWTGRFLSTGNGGLNGCVKYEDLAYGSESGFAVVGSNNGHDGERGTAFYQNDDVVADFAWRSIYTETVVGKAMAKAYYSKELTKSYYIGCSTGGRQGFKMAQSYPELFDGILAGAPAIAFNNLTAWSGHFLLITGSPDSETYLTPEKWSLVHDDILKQCDGLDGVEDGILEDPNLCHYKPVSLQCASDATNTSACLTPVQVTTVTNIFAPYYGEQGALIYPRIQPGAEILGALINFNGQIAPYTEDWFRFAILQDPNWDATTLNSSTAALAAAINPSNIQTWEGDLSAFQNKGGKLLTYHGLMDGVISSDNSPRYYEHVSTTMGLAPSELDSFYRFFRISGLAHCTGGDGAWNIGQATGGGVGAQKNALQRIIDWVEKGDAPETVTGVKYVDGDKTKGVDYERNHCKYPLRNKFVGPGSYKEVDAWECVP